MQMGICTWREGEDPAPDLGCTLTRPWADPEASKDCTVLHVPRCVGAGSRQAVLSGLSSLKSEFLGTSVFQLGERRKTR